jgi:uncharacterized protein (DUF1778 family)
VKTSQLQIRVSPAQKEALRRRARAAGLTVSEYVLSRSLPKPEDGVAEILRAVGREATRRHALAELSDLLAGLDAETAGRALEDADRDLLRPADLNLVAAMVEHAAASKGVAPPGWTASVPVPEEPLFGSDLPRLRAHLVRESPVAYRRRNIFVDAVVGDRV